jgi:hypothetical protein
MIRHSFILSKVESSGPSSKFFKMCAPLTSLQSVSHVKWCRPSGFSGGDAQTMNLMWMKKGETR